MLHAVVDGTGRVPNDDIGVRAGNQGALARVQPKNTRRVGAVERHELVGGHTPAHHAMRPQHRQAVAHAGQAVGDECKVLAPQFLAGDGDLAAFIHDRAAAVIIKWAVIGGNGLDGAVLQALPQALIVQPRAHGRRADPLGAIRAAQIILGEEQVLRAGLAHHLQAVLAGVGQHINLAGHIHMHKV